jgi:hypothetical protein
MFCGIDNHGGKNDLADVGGEGRALCRSFGGVDQEVVGPYKFSGCCCILCIVCYVGYTTKKVDNLAHGSVSFFVASYLSLFFPSMHPAETNSLTRSLYSWIAVYLFA